MLLSVHIACIILTTVIWYLCPPTLLIFVKLSKRRSASLLLPWWCLWGVGDYSKTDTNIATFTKKLHWLHKPNVVLSSYCSIVLCDHSHISPLCHASDLHLAFLREQCKLAFVPRVYTTWNNFSHTWQLFLITGTELLSIDFSWSALFSYNWDRTSSYQGFEWNPQWLYVHYTLGIVTVHVGPPTTVTEVMKMGSSSLPKKFTST